MQQFQYVGSNPLQFVLNYTNDQGLPDSININVVTNDIINLPENDSHVQQWLTDGVIKHYPRDGH